MSQMSVTIPDPEPQDEEILQQDHAFADACMLAMAEDMKNLGWRLGTSIVTRSLRWGLVWRADIESNNQAMGSSALLSRVVCWRQPSSDDLAVSVVFRQNLRRLG